MKTTALIVTIVLAVTLVAGCSGGGGSQDSIQGLLNMQCKALMSEDVDGYVNLFEASVTNPEWVEQGKPLIEMTFGMADITGCTQTVVDVNEDGDTASGTVKKYMKIDIFGQVQEDTITETRSFVKIDEKWYDAGQLS